MTLIQASGISKRQGNEWVVSDFSFTLEPFNKMVIAGETGSGKSTLLKIIAGLVQPDAGQILFDGKKVEGPLEKLIPGVDGISYLSQHFELRNNYRVEELLSYANILPGEEADIVFEVCRIDHLLKRRTDQLSGGEKQRIALARLIISSPRLLILDEPFSNLDLIHKSILKSVIADIGAKLRITCILVSHDPDDTLYWADEILVMKAGRLVQQGTPRHIYHHPINEYVAGLFGKYHILSAHMLASMSEMQNPKSLYEKIYFRPEDFDITSRKTKLKGIVKNIFFFGSWYEIEVMLPEDTVMVRSSSGNIRKGDTVYLSLSGAGF